MPRVEFEGAVYHVMCRGNRREVIFHTEEDRVMFLQTLGEGCARSGWRVHAFALMGNHNDSRASRRCRPPRDLSRTFPGSSAHLCMELPEANLVRGMHWFQVTYMFLRAATRHW